MASPSRMFAADLSLFHKSHLEHPLVLTSVCSSHADLPHPTQLSVVFGRKQTAQNWATENVFPFSSGGGCVAFLTSR
eukprot:1210692-Pyramimonas_sp.AAC.2